MQGTILNGALCAVQVSHVPILINYMVVEASTVSSMESGVEEGGLTEAAVTDRVHKLLYTCYAI